MESMELTDQYFTAFDMPTRTHVFVDHLATELEIEHMLSSATFVEWEEEDWRCMHQ